MTRYYSATAVDNTLAASITSGSTSMVLSTLPIGYPSNYPFTLAIDYNTATEELVQVTAFSGTTVTISRANAGLGSNTVGTAAAHGVGAVVRHVITAQDLTDAQNHYNASSAIHGVTGSVVGTTDTQTLTNKTISAASNTLTGIVTPSSTDILTNKTISGSSNTVTNLPISTAISGLGTGIATFLGTPTSANLAAAVTDKVGSGPLVFANLVINAQTGTTYTIASTDANLLVTLNNAAAVTLTIPPSVFTTGQQINIQQIGAGQVTLAAGSGVTITSTGATAAAPKLRAQYSAATIICTATNTFTVLGDIA